MALNMRIENTDKIINPVLLEENDKRYYQENGIRFICMCRRKPALMYAFRKKTNALYPIHNEYSKMHAPFCSLNERYSDRNYANALQKDNISGGLKVSLKENITKRPVRFDMDNTEQYMIKRCPLKSDVSRQIVLSRLLTDINLEVCYQQSQRAKNGQKKLKTAEDFSKEVYRKAENCEITNRGIFMAGETLKPYGMDFRYARIKGIIMYDFDNGTKVEKLREKLGKDYTAYLKKRIGENKRTHVKICFQKPTGEDTSRQINEKTLYCALTQYMDVYGSDGIDFKNNNIMGGFYSYEDEYEDKNGIRRSRMFVERMTMFLTNKYGIFSESLTEAAAYNTIMDFCNENDGIYFYKPYRFTLNSYGGEYLEDGIIEVPGGKQVILEMVTEEDTRTKERLKKKYYVQNKDSYIFLQWERDEGMDILKEKLKECIKKAKQ